jgi:hypothetical protein
MCTARVDGMNAVAHHIAENVDFAIVAAADPAAWRAHARTRSWNRLRLLSAGDTPEKPKMEILDVYSIPVDDGEVLNSLWASAAERGGCNAHLAPIA